MAKPVSEKSGKLASDLKNPPPPKWPFYCVFGPLFQIFQKISHNAFGRMKDTYSATSTPKIACLTRLLSQNQVICIPLPRNPPAAQWLTPPRQLQLKCVWGSKQKRRIFMRLNYCLQAKAFLKYQPKTWKKSEKIPPWKRNFQKTKNFENFLETAHLRCKKPNFWRPSALKMWVPHQSLRISNYVKEIFFGWEQVSPVLAWIFGKKNIENELEMNLKSAQKSKAGFYCILVSFYTNKPIC